MSMTWAERSRAAFPLPVLLGAIMLLAGAFAYEAVTALRAREALAARTLHDYAAFAASELATKAGELMAQQLRDALGPATAIPASSPYDRMSSLEPVIGEASRVLPCEEASAGHDPRVFQLDLRDAALSVRGDASPAFRRWLADTLVTAVRLTYRPDQRFAILGGLPEEPGLVIAFAVKWAQLGPQPVAPIGAVGLVRCRSAFGSPLVRQVLRTRALLPALAGALPNDSLLAVSLRDSTGAVVWLNATDGAPDLTAEVPLETPAGLRLSVALREGALARLRVGAPATSRLPWLVVLLAVTAGLALVALWQLRREQELARLRSDFTSSVSHELRTPLTQILLSAETLTLGRTRSESERGAAAGVIVDEARRLIHMVENVLSFARLERGVHQVDCWPTRLAPHVRGILTRWLAVATDGVRIVPMLDEAAWARVDAGALTQVLGNLVDNAVKYGAPGQTVTVRLTRDGSLVRLAVEDEGPGVPEPARGRVWEPFVRMHGGETGRPGGTGLGLTVVRELVRAMDGTTAVEQVQGSGARFVITLPACEAEPPDGTTRPLSSDEAMARSR
jgi:signal transduction histidine kinase